MAPTPPVATAPMHPPTSNLLQPQRAAAKRLKHRLRSFRMSLCNRRLLARCRRSLVRRPCPLFPHHSPLFCRLCPLFPHLRPLFRPLHPLLRRLRPPPCGIKGFRHHTHTRLPRRVPYPSPRRRLRRPQP